MQQIQSASAHRRTVTEISLEAMGDGALLWGNVRPGNIDASWDEVLPLMKRKLIENQAAAALDGFLYTGLALAEQGMWEASSDLANMSSLLGYSSAGYPLDFTLRRPVIAAKQGIANGLAPGFALEQAGNLLAAILRTQVKDVARVAASIDVAAKRQIGYTRMVGPKSCGRCIVLAGKYYKWNAGFLRHPNCNCVHVPATMDGHAAAVSEGLIQDPYRAFEGMSPEQKSKSFGAANAAAIEDGADIYQVVNARRGVNGLYTTEGTTSRGYSSALAGRRLTPDAIYAKNLSREQTLDLLRKNNYVLPGGQVPGGSITGQRDGYGALGRGGTRVGARYEIDRARLTGIRNPATRATMTEAERRVFDATARYEAVLKGRNPFDRQGRGLTPQISAQVEADYKRWLATGGQKFIN